MVVAIVQNVTGNVWARAEDGSLRLLQDGDQLLVGEIIITGDNASVELVYDNNVLLLTANQTLELGESVAANAPVQIQDVTINENTVAAILDLLEGDGDLLAALDPAAAGLDGAGDSEGNTSFVRLLRISESLDPIQFGGNINNLNFTTAPEVISTGYLEGDDILPDGALTVAGEVNTAAATIAVSGTSVNIPVGNTVVIVISDQNGVTVRATATINPDGSYAATGIDVSTLTDGPIVITATTTDAGGNPVEAEGDGLILDLVDGTLDIDAVANDDQSTLDISGTTTDVPPGDIVDIVITDQNGNTVTTSAIVNPDGSYEVGDVDVSDLTDGTLTIVGTSTDNHGNPVQGETQVTLDAVIGSLTVDGEFAGDAIIDITGTTNDVPPGSTVAITITDQNGATVITSATVGDDGTYSVDNVDVSSLADGTLEIYAESVDNNGNTVSDTDTLLLGLIESALTVSASLETGESSLDISGTSVEVPAGNIVNLTITDSNGVTIITSATVDASGNYSVDAVDVTGLEEGILTIVATTTDVNGDPLVATTTVVMDRFVEEIVPGTLAVDGTIDNDDASLDITGTTTLVGTGVSVTLTITDTNGATIITSATVDGDGSYSVSGIDVSGLTPGALVITASTSDINGFGLTANDTVVFNIPVIQELPPTLAVTAGEALTREEAEAGDVVATSVANDPDGDNANLVFSFTPGINDDGYYAIDPATGAVTLTEAGKDHVNSGGDLPIISVTVTDEQGLTATDTANVTILEGEAPVDPEELPPTLVVTAGDPLTQGEAAAGDVVATSVANDPDGDNANLVFSFTPGINDDGYYAIDPATGTVTLTEAGKDHVNSGGDLPIISVTVTDEQGLTATDTANVTINEAPSQPPVTAITPDVAYSFSPIEETEYELIKYDTDPVYALNNHVNQTYQQALDAQNGVDGTAGNLVFSDIGWTNITITDDANKIMVVTGDDEEATINMGTGGDNVLILLGGFHATLTVIFPVSGNNALVLPGLPADYPDLASQVTGPYHVYYMGDGTFTGDPADSPLFDAVTETVGYDLDANASFPPSVDDASVDRIALINVPNDLAVSQDGTEIFADGDGYYWLAVDANGQLDGEVTLMGDGNPDLIQLLVQTTQNGETVNIFMGTDGNDTIQGSEDSDIIIGGGGGDTLTGFGGADTFAWQLGNQGTGSPAVDIITDFNAAEGDAIDISDLLQGESEATIGNYLSMNFDGTDTIISVSHTSGGPVTQEIVLQGVDLTDGGATISDLLSNGTIKIDS